MAVEQLTIAPTEAELEARMHPVIRRVFPWLGANAIRHQTKFAFKFGRSTVHVDGKSIDYKEARADIVLYHDEKPLAVVELKREGIPLSTDDEAQGLSYARVLNPSPPLVIVTNGNEVKVVATHTGAALSKSSLLESEFETIVRNAAQVANADLKEAIQTLMGSAPRVWCQAVERVTNASIEELTATSDSAALPFNREFILPRKAAALVQVLLDAEERLIIVEGAPFIGKSNVLLNLILNTRLDNKFIILFLETGGSGVLQVLADALARELDWPVTREEARSWLIRLSRSDGPALVLAIDGFDPDESDFRREIEDLTGSTFGNSLRVVLAADDAVADRLVVAASGRVPSLIGRRSKHVIVGPLDDQEFDAARQILWSQRISIMDGGQSARELRLPWVIRALRLDVMQDSRYESGSVAALPPLLSLDLIKEARQRFPDPELRRLTRGVARAILDDQSDLTRAIPLQLEALGTYMFRRETLARHIDAREIETLIYRGYLKAVIHNSGAAILVVRLPELVASEIAEQLALDLISRIQADSEAAAKWLADISFSLPLGDVVCAQAVLDSVLRHGGISWDFINALIRSRPTKEEIPAGMRFAGHFPGLGFVHFTKLDDGALVAEVGRKSVRIERDQTNDVDAAYSNLGAWLILSHLASQAFAIVLEGNQIRVDPYILMEVGTAPMVLRHMSPEEQNYGILTHEIPGHGDIVCSEAGIVEPITLAILHYISRDGRETQSWIKSACDRGSLPLIARIDIALRELSTSADKDKAAFADEMRSGPVRASFEKLPQLHPTASSDQMAEQ